MSDKPPYPTTVEEILAGVGLIPGHQPPAPAALAIPQPQVITTAGYAGQAPYGPQPTGYAPVPYVVQVPQIITQPAPVAAQQTAGSADVPLWLRLSALLSAVGVCTAGVGFGIGQAAPGLAAGARFLFALAAVGGVGLVAFLLVPRGGRQSSAVNVTNNIHASVSTTQVGRQRNKF